MAELQAANVKVVTPVRLIPGMFKLGYIVDPGGVKIDVVQDLEALGFHHFHLRAIDPDALSNSPDFSIGPIDQRFPCVLRGALTPRQDGPSSDTAPLDGAFSLSHVE
jgi:hypothetical protein